MTDINFDNVDFSKFEDDKNSQIDPETGIDLSRFQDDPEAPARKEAFIRAKLKAQNVTPDKAVSAKNDGKTLGVDYESALNNPEIIKQRKILESQYYDELAKKYPTTALFMTDPQNHAIAQGDEENLGIFERSVKALDELGSAFGAGWRGMAAQDEGKIYFDKHILGKDLTKYDVKSHSRAGVNPTITGEQRLAQSIKDTQLYGQETKYYAKQGVAPDMMRATGYGFANLGYMAKNAVTGLFEDIGQLGSDIYENPTAAPMLVGAAATSIASKGKIDPTKALKAKDVGAKLLGADLAAFVVTDSFKQNTNEAHQLYTGVRDEEGNPMPANIAKTAAIMSGSLNASLDALQMGMITKTFSPVVQAALRKLGKKGMNEAIAEALKRKTGRDIVKKYITTAGKLVLAEGAVEGTQSIIKDTIRLIAEGNAEKQGNAKFVSPTLFEGTDKEESILARAGHDSVEAIKSTLAIGFLGASPKAFAESRLQNDIAKFEEDKAKLDAINDAVNGTETIVRDPETMARLARSFGGDADTKQLYMDAEKTRDLFQGMDAARDPVDIVNELFGQETANRFSEALSTSTTFAVPFDSYVIKVMGTGLYEQAKEFTQLNAYSLSAEDIANFESLQQQHLDELKRTADNIENAPSAVKQVYDDVYGQIESLNLPFLNKTDRSMFAALWAKKMATASIRKYQTPDKAYEMYDAPYKTKFVNEVSKLNDLARTRFDSTVDPLIDSLRAGTMPSDSEIYGDTLMEGLRKLGISDDRGDLKSMDVDKDLKPFTRKLLRDDGMTLDDAAQWAVDNGYIQEADINALIAAIDSDLRGSPVYNMNNPNEERLGRKQKLEELQNYFDKQGINISEFSNDELKALLSGDNTLYQQEQALKLMITHNLTEGNLLHAAKLGGLPVPSLAIVNANTPIDSFGEITLLGSKEMADPKGYAKTKVFGADIYSPRYPRVIYKLTQSAVDRLHAKLRDINALVGGRLPDKSEIESYGAQELSNSSAVKALFLKEKGLSFDVVTKEVAPLPDFLMTFTEGKLSADQLRESEEFKKAVIDNHNSLTDKLLAEETDADARERYREALELTDIEMKRVIRSNAFKVTSYREQIKEKGTPDNYKTKNNIEKVIEDKSLQPELEKFSQGLLSSMNPEEKIHKGNQKFIPHTIENVIKILKTDLRGGEGFNYRIGSLRAKFTPEFKSIKQIREEGSRLLDSESFAKVKDEIELELQFVVDSISRNGKTVSEDTAFGILEDIPSMGMSKVIKDYNVDITEEGMQSIAEFLTRLKAMPTEYFEAKILRSVDVSEFSGAVIPANATQQTRDTLTNAGVQFREYQEGNRAKVLRELAYDLSEQGKNTLFQQEQKQIDAVRAQYEGTDQWMKAPNGQPTKLNEVQWLQVRTPNFKAWFGDFENDPKNASQVVDSNGEPMVVYHGTSSDFDAFNKDTIGKNFNESTLGFYFTNAANASDEFGFGTNASEYAKNAGNTPSVIPVFLSIKNPHVISDSGEWGSGGAVSAIDIQNSDIKRWTKNKNDGVLSYDKTGEDLERVFVTFDPTQIKSAIGNTGEFSKDNPNILYQSEKENSDLTALGEFNQKDDVYQFDNYQEREDILDRLVNQYLNDALFEGMELPTGYGKITISPSAKEGGKWQVTQWAKDGLPNSDEGIQTKEKALRMFFEQSSPQLVSKRIPIYRIDAQGFDRNIIKPHGLYVSIPSDISTFDSPHKEVGDTSFSGYATPKNPLNVDSVKIQHKRGNNYPVETSAGVSALKQLVDAKLFDSLIKADKAELTATIKEQFPDIDTSQYHDAYELLEVLGAQLAKQDGYDAIIQKVEGDPMNEMVILDNSIIGDLNKRELFQSLSDDKEQRLYQISAWHGSPFKFNRFSLAHLGLGEGNQAYGWGLYFAASKEVAEWYRTVLSEQQGKHRTHVTYDGIAYEFSEGSEHEAQALIRALVSKGHTFRDSLEALMELRKYPRLVEARKAFTRIVDGDSTRYTEAEIAKEDKFTKEVILKPRRILKILNEMSIDEGQLYKVDIDVIEDGLLLWDVSFEEQPKVVQQALLALGYKPKAKTKYLSLEEDGGSIYRDLTGTLGGQKEASLALKKNGVDGIKYLDGGSRQAGEGKYNYVVFDDKAVEILKTYYQSLGQGAKGYLSIKSNREMLVTLTGKADFSTLLHESAHLWLEMMLDDLKSADVTQQAQNDWAVISNYFASYADKAKAEILADNASLERDVKKLEGMKKRSPERDLELRQKNAMIEAHKKAIAMIDANPDLLKEVAKDFGQSIGDNDVKNILTKPYHEQFARSMEAYFREGKAPSTDLLEAFSRFKYWLQDILYPFLKMLGVELTDDVRGVFDRMIATDAEIESVQQIQQAQRNFDAKMLKELGLTDEQIETYEKLAVAATTDAEDKLRAADMRDQLKKKTDEYKAELDAIKQEVADELSKQPAQILLHFLRTGEFKEGTESLFPIEPTRLDTQSIIDTYGKQQLKELPRGVYGRDGKHPDIVANAFGISSGSKLMDMLINEPLNTVAKQNTYIKEEAARRMNERNPDLVSIDKLSSEAQKAIHGDKRAELMIAEMNALSKKTNKPFTPAAMLYDLAMRQFDNMHIEDINALKYLSAERKINRDIRKQIAQGDFDAALVGVQKALFNQYMYNQAVKVEEQIKQGIDAAKRYDKKAVREKIAKGGAQEYIVLQDGDKVASFPTKAEAMAYSALNEGTYVTTQNSYLEMIDSIRGAYSFKKVPKWLITQQDLFAKLYRAALDEGLSLPFDPTQFAKPKNYTKLTLREFNDVIGALKVIEKVSNLSQGMETQYGKLDMNEVLSLMEQTVSGLKSRKVKFEHNKHFVDSALEGIDSFAAFQTTINAYVHALDGAETAGIFHDVLILPQREAFIKENKMLLVKDERVDTIFKPVYAEVDKKDVLGNARLGQSLDKLSTGDLDKILLGNRVHLQSLNTDLSIQDIMGMAWLMGHKGGREALTHPEMVYNVTSGGLWTEENIIKALEVLTPVQLKAVNDGWALYDKYWPEAQALDMRTKGYAPPKVDATPYMVGDVAMTGGYSRLMYNKKDDLYKFRTDDDLQTMEDIVTGKGTVNQTNSGSTKARVGSGGKAPRLDFGVMDEHLGEVIHDIANREMVIQTYKLITNKRFMKVIDSKLGEAALGQFLPWVVRLAKGEPKPTSILERMVGKANNASSIMFLGLSLFNAIQNATGLPVASALLGGKWVALGMAEFAKNPSAAVRFTMSKSGLIYVRRKTNQYSNDAKRALKTESFTGTGGDVARLAYAPQQFVQNMVDGAVWLGAYRKATAGKVQGVDALNDAECVAFADRMIENTQSSGAIKDLSNLFARGEYMRMLTLMGSYFNMIFNMGRIRLGKRKYEPMTERYFNDAMFTIYIMVLPVLVTTMMRYEPPKEDEDLDDWATRTHFYKDLAAYPFASVVVVRSLATAYVHPEFGVSAVPSLAYLNGVFKGSVAAGKLFDSESELERKDYKAMIEGVGYAFALPTKSVYKMGEPLYDYTEGNESGVDELRVLRSMILGKPRED